MRVPGKNMDFGSALHALRNGYRVRRADWQGPTWIRMQLPNDGSKITLPYALFKTREGHLVPWVASQTDIFAGDWEIVE